VFYHFIVIFADRIKTISFMARNQDWQNDYWLLLMQVYLKKPVGVKPVYSKIMVDLSMELHIAPQILFNKMCEIANLETPRIERIWQEYGANPRRLNRAVSLFRQMKGFGNNEEFYEGVDLQETFERDFRPINDDTPVTPVMLILVPRPLFPLDTYHNGARDPRDTTVGAPDKDFCQRGGEHHGYLSTL
jgi:hypothetical protein